MVSYWSRFASGRLSRRRALIAGSGAGAGALALLAGCGSDDAGGLSQPKDASGLITVPEDTTKNAKKGGTYRSYTNLDPINFDPFQAESASGGLPTDAYIPLVRQKAGYMKAPTVGEVEGEGAVSWEVAADGLSVTFKLQPNGRFEPRAPVNGRAVTTEDVVFSYQKWEALYRNRLRLSHKANPDAPLESITAIDRNTVIAKFAFPDAEALPLMSSIVIQPVEAEDKYDPRVEMRGSGPWMMTDYKRSSYGTYERNPNYHATDEYFIDKIEQYIIPEQSTRIAQFRAGNIWDSPVTTADLVSTKKDVPELNLYYNPAVATTISFSPLGWLEGSAFRDIRVRRALAMAVDGELMSEALYDVDRIRSAGLPIDFFYNTCITAGHTGHWLDPKTKEFGANSKYLEYNPDEAKKLLAAAGYADGLETPALIQTEAYGTNHIRANEIALGMFADVGIRTKVSVLSIRPDFENRVFNGRGKFVGLSFFINGSSTGLETISGQYLPKGSRYFGFDVNGVDPENGDPTLTDMIRKAKQERDSERRIGLVHDIQRYAADKQYYPRTIPAYPTSFVLGWPAVQNQRTWINGPRLRGQWIDTTKPPFKV